MSPGAFLIFALFCAFGFAAAEIESHRWMTEDRRTVNDIPRYRQQYNSTNDGRGYYYNNRPVYRYNYGLNEANQQTGRHHNRKPVRNGLRPYTSGIYRTYGTGKATIPKLGATVSVSNSVPRPQRVHKGTITARVLTPPLDYYEASPRVITRSRRECMSCPQNRAVVASRGHAHVILPEPCPTMRWKSISGPRPGTLIAEGTHSLIGRLGHRGKICQYEYEVIVRHCGTFTVQSGNANCTIDDAWGSVCTITCDDGYELVGSDVLKCADDLKWSSQTPICKKKKGCPLPQTPDNGKIWCQIPDENDLSDNNLPADTYCRFKSDGRQRIIYCVDGYWVNKHARGRRNHRTVKRRKNKKVDDDDDWKKNSIPDLATNSVKD